MMNHRHSNNRTMVAVNGKKRVATRTELPAAVKRIPPKYVGLPAAVVAHMRELEA